MDAQEIRDAQNGMYGGKNKPITDGKYDQSLAVKCVNGTFVGQESEQKIVDWERTYFLTNYYMP
jgi:para-nitrobenzyl esterase